MRINVIWIYYSLDLNWLEPSLVHGERKWKQLCSRTEE